MRLRLRNTDRSVAFWMALALLVVSASCPGQRQQAHRAAPHFAGSTIPDPPQQKEPWTPPATTLPKFLVRASATLFEQGLADPRGCDYRALEIGVGSVWGGSGVIETHGWVLPERPGETTRFAVAWSGLVYPAIAVGAPADLAADVKTLEAAARVAREAQAKRDVREASGFGGFGTNQEEYPVSLRSVHPIKLSLLLRNGRADLAEAVWAAAMGRPREEAAKRKSDLSNYGVSYLSMATDLVWYHFDRAVCAHMRGDDAVALADARALTSLQKAVEAKADEMGFDRPRRFVDRGDGPAPYLDFLGQLPELMADQERRAREPKRPPVPPPGSDPKARITALIDDLDQAAARQMSQPGGVSLGEAEVVQALIKEGDAAVGPLLDDLERDVRLTRSVHFHRNFFRSRIIMGAHEAAYTALSGILKTSFFGAASTGDNLSARGLQGRKQVADRIRAYWEKNRDVPLVERWYRTLADDLAGPGQWLQAAGSIARHENVRIVPGSTAFTSAVTTPLPAGARPKLLGEVLREKQNPSVAELMAGRVTDIDPGGPIDANSSDQFKVGSANQMAGLLAEWDSKAALPVLKARVKRCSELVQAGQEAGRRFHGLELGIANLTELRRKGGDPDALDDYAAWVRTVTPAHFDFNPIAMFEPVWRNADHPAIAAAAVALFEDPKSPWNPSIHPENLDSDRGFRLDLLGSSLLGVTSFRTLVLRALTDKTQVGTVETDTKGKVVVIQGQHKTVSDGDSTTVSVEISGEPDEPKNPFKPGSSAMPLRVADLVCEKLEQLEGIPRFQKQWSLAKRDGAIAATIAYLKQYGERFRQNEASRAIRTAEPSGARHERAVLAFDPLDQPATAGDVAAGRAIFSLRDKGAEVRRIELSSFPEDARWTKLEVFPNDPPIMRVYDAKGHEFPNTEALQTGRVWQAEEVREGDRWRRYYGFVGRHALTRVVAEEIELPASWRSGWRFLSADLDARIDIKEAASTGPVPAELSFRNHHGVDTTAPTDLVRDADGAPTIREGIALRLVRESDKPEAPNAFAERAGGAREKPFPPKEISSRTLRRHPKGAALQTLAPAGTAQAFRLDLRTLFPIDRPGRYRLEITFDDLKTADGAPGKVAAVFGVASRASE